VSVAGFEVKYLVRGQEDELAFQKLAVAFERAGDELADFGKYVFPLLGPAFEAALGAQFAQEGGGPNRGSWAALTPAYEAWKSQHYPGQPVLVRTGALKEALTSSGSAHAARDYSASMFNFGTQGLQYASYHQTGTRRMVDRPPFDFASEFERELARLAYQGAREAMQSAELDKYVDIPAEADS
jgi:hypothetical protein